VGQGAPTGFDISDRIGANQFSNRSVICLHQLGADPGLQPVALRRALDALLALPHVHDQGPCESIERLDDTTTPQLLIGALALTLLRKGGVSAERFGVIDETQAPMQGCWFECCAPGHGRAAANAALAIANNARTEASEGELNDLVVQAVEDTDQAVHRPFASVFRIAADSRVIPWRRASRESSGFDEMGIGARSRRFHESAFDVESKFAVELAKSKAAATAMLQRAGISVPRNRVCRNMQEVERAASEIGFPVVVKPLRGGVGRGVTVDIRDLGTLRSAAQAAAQYQGPLVVEEFVPGRQYRLLAIDGRVLFCSEQDSATVTGDGTHTIAQLCEIENRNPERGKAARLPLRPIDIEAIGRKVTTPFGNRGYHLESVLPASVTVRLVYDPRRPEGSSLTNVTASTHPDYFHLAKRITRLAGIWTCGIDLMVTDITKPISEAPYWVNEINTHPGISIYSNFFSGLPRSNSEMLLDSVFPGPRDFRVPVVAVVSDEDASGLVREIAHAIGKTGLDVVAAHSKGYQFADLDVGAGDFATFAGNQRAFFDRSAEAIIVERRPEALSPEGFGIAFADVVVFCPPDREAPAFWHRSGFLAGVVDAAFALAPGPGAPGLADAVPPGVDWLQGEQTQPEQAAGRVAARLAEVAEGGLPAMAG